MKTFIAGFFCAITLLLGACNNVQSTDVAKVRAADYEISRTHSQAIEAAIAAAKEQSEIIQITLDSHDWLIDRAVEVPSNCTLIIKDCTLKLKDGLCDNIIRSANIVPDPDKFYDRCLRADKAESIKILGVGNAILEGPDKPRIAYNPYLKKVVPWTGDFYGWRTVSMMFTNVSNYEIANIKMRKTLCWAISQEWGCTRGYLHDIEFDTDVKNGDGIDFRSGCSHCVVENITGRTSDDTVACTSLNTTLTHPKYIHRMQTLGYERGMDNSIHHITIRNIFTTGKHHGVICLATSPKVHDITIENVVEPTPSERESCVKIYTGYGNGYTAGNLNNIKVKNVKSLGAKYAVQIAAQTKDVSIEEVRQENPDGVAISIKGTSENLNVKNISTAIK